MNFDRNVLDELTQRAKESPRLRMNLDLRNSPEDGSQRMLNALEPGTVLVSSNFASADFRKIKTYNF